MNRNTTEVKEHNTTEITEETWRSYGGEYKVSYARKTRREIRELNTNTENNTMKPWKRNRQNAVYNKRKNVDENSAANMEKT